MDTSTLKRQFRLIGTDVHIRIRPKTESRRFAIRSPAELELDIQPLTRSERYIFSVREDIQPSLEISAVNVRPDLQHLLLQIRRHDIRIKEKFLCGHDERHWFIATVNPRVRDVLDAMESLKPTLAVDAQLRNGVKFRNRNRRHNAGFIRQGEWFFVPMPHFEKPADRIIFHKEPLKRPLSKPHIVDDLIRIGGQTVFVSHLAPAGLSPEAHQQLLREDPSAQKANWRAMTLDAEVYVRGRVRHPDHATLKLPFWHRVLMNREVQSRMNGAGATVLFLD